jgi:hypothetical protein
LIIVLGGGLRWPRLGLKVMLLPRWTWQPVRQHAVSTLLPELFQSTAFRTGSEHDSGYIRFLDAISSLCKSELHQFKHAIHEHEVPQFKAF